MYFLTDIEIEAQKSYLLKISANRVEAKLRNHFHLTPKLIGTTLLGLRRSHINAILNEL